MKNKILHLIKRRIADLEFYINNRHNDATGVLLTDAWKYAKTTYTDLKQKITTESDDIHLKDVVLTQLRTLYATEFRQNLLNQEHLQHFYMYTDCELLIKDIQNL